MVKYDFFRKILAQIHSSVDHQDTKLIQKDSIRTKTLKTPKNAKKIVKPMIKEKPKTSKIKKIIKKRVNFCCDQCGKEFGQRNLLCNHILKHIPKELRERNFKCQFCPKAYHTKSILDFHVQHIHPADGQQTVWKCDCGKTFSNKKFLQLHKYKTHNRDAIKRICEHCGKVFGDGTKLKEHIRIHHTEGGRGNYMCYECGKLYDTQTKLTVHINRCHMGRSIVCDEIGCNRIFSAKAGLRRHKRTFHLQIKNHHCNYEDCGKKFFTTQVLKRHINIVHKKLREECPVEDCKFVVGRRDYMNNHLKKHVELKPQVLDELLEIVKNMNLI